MAVDYVDTLIADIRRLKKEKNAIILAHNYVLGDVQDVADFVGDSLELSKKARQVDEEVIVFCGVSFMAETAKILSPEKKVIHPVTAAGCPMADMADAPALRRFKQDHPDAVTVCYVNSSASLKAEVDICCTSSNAEEIIGLIPEDRRIIFLPDKNLGANVARATGRQMILWEGFCPTHMRLRPAMLERKKEEFPHAVVIAHPECRPEVLDLADYSLSTGGMLSFARSTEAKQLIVATELGIIHRLQKENPDKQFIPISEQAVCMTMKMIELEDVKRSLETLTPKVELEPDIITQAKAPIVRMIEQRLDI
ncbi:quinolinate synthase NadA [Chitinivibrio alkaliphilus]|uniref:Quinolinate synthase n=1 Tax=Chitinivibrio alkaliphilus ACht1 TaxID=1313304 RepID=U7D9J2_9BACT|nr:quinolinate synthase NadA [Chitinivibrio alkaliphilus]ERP31080.1 quinolinate synthetase complex, A subunit [Chitinivibrio alkaliphilus ACht1]